MRNCCRLPVGNFTEFLNTFVEQLIDLLCCDYRLQGISPVVLPSQDNDWNEGQSVCCGNGV